MITLTNGHVQNCANGTVPNGSISFQLNVDATVIASPYGFVAANPPIVFQFDANGNILPNLPAAAAQIWSNAELNPQNSVGLGTYYLVSFYDANGGPINKTPMWWQFTEANGATVDIGQMVPFATVGGNVIFYPTSFFIAAPTPSSLGGVFSNAGAPSQWISAINLNGSVTLSQPSFADISGTISNAQLPNPLSFSSITASGLITAQANIQLGVSGSLSGAITFEGSTSGSSTITAPAIAGTASNPFTFSNGINIPSGTAFSINSDTGISRDSAGVIDIGNGTPGDKTGTVNAATFNGAISSTAISGSKTLVTATQPTFRLTDSELTLGPTVTSVSGSAAAVRGNTTVASAATITGASYLYGAQGKLTVQGALNSTAEVSCGVLGQLDLSVALASSAPIAAGWFDCGATMSAALISSPAAIDGIVIYNTTNAVIDAVIRAAANATYLFNVTDLAYGGAHFVAPLGGASIQTTALKVQVNGATYYIPLYA